MSKNPEPKTFLGKYRGTVINNLDPEFRGRLLLEVPDVLGVTPSSWAEPCVPLAGPTGAPLGMGVFMVPPIGAGVWVEFEQGDPSRPIWVGCRWGTTADVPKVALTGLPVSPSIVLQTMGQNAIVLSDMPPAPPPLGGAPLPPGIAPGGITLTSPTGAHIVVNDTGIYISNGKGASIMLTANTVMVNMTALVVI